MAVPLLQNLTITRGDTETIVVTILSDDGVTPINITGRTYTSQIRTTPNSSIISASFTCTVTNGAAGQVTATLLPAVSALLEPGYYYWDFQENASGVISTIFSGQVTVLADVTR